ncbi:MAG: flagellar biosynthetic protein FliO [Proteobacteria bacterium]|nr:flagellar biosynthetic protein FliO [Pseudomonadota bacterium]
MLRFVFVCLLLQASKVWAQEVPASANLMTIGPIDGESDQKASIITIRYDAKPGFAKPKIEAHGSFLQVILPQTLVGKPGIFTEANSPYIRKFAAFQLDEQTAGLRLFVTKDAAQILPAVSTDILENRVVVVIDHAEAEKQLLLHFDGVPVEGGPSPEEIVKKTEVRSNIPDPVAPNKPASPLPPAPSGVKTEKSEPSVPNWNDGLQNKLVMVTIFSVVMLLLLLGIKTWRRIMSKKWSLAPVETFNLKTLASHHVGPKQKITVVQVGGEQILLGVSPDGISFLTSLKKQEEPPRLQLDPNALQKSQLLSTPVQRADLATKRPRISEDIGSKNPAKTRTTSRDELPVPGSSISYGVGDQGIRNMNQASPSRKAEESNSIDDVTRMIRKKLRDLPKV